MPTRDFAADQAAASVAAGVYGWLVDREEAAYRDWSGGAHGRGGGAYPRRVILDTLRAGVPLTVRWNELPGWACAGRPVLTRADGDEYWRRQLDAVTVHPDDLVVPCDAGPPLDEYRDL